MGWGACALAFALKRKKMLLLNQLDLCWKKARIIYRMVCFFLLLHLSCRFDLTRPISMWQQRRRQQQHKNQKQKRKNRKCIKLGSAWSSKHSENNLMAIWPLCFDSKCVFFSFSLSLIRHYHNHLHTHFGNWPTQRSNLWNRMEFFTPFAHEKEV